MSKPKSADATLLGVEYYSTLRDYYPPEPSTANREVGKTTTKLTITRWYTHPDWGPAKPKKGRLGHTTQTSHWEFEHGCTLKCGHDSGTVKLPSGQDFCKVCHDDYTRRHLSSKQLP